MRDLLIAAIVLASLPVGLFKPYYGVLIYSWISYMYPQELAWGFVRSWPVAKIAGVSALLGGVFQQNGDWRPLRERESVLMILLFLIFTISSVFAFYPADAWADWQNMAKIIAISLFTSCQLIDRRRLQLFFGVVGLSLGFYGIKGGIFSFASGGEQTVYGPGTSILGANNALGVALNMCLPVLWYLSKDVHQAKLKRGLQLAFLLTIPAIMFTYSRASALALGVVLLVIIIKSRRGGLALALIGVLSVSIVGLLPDKWVHRQKTTLEYTQDSSAMSRLGEWDFCWRVALDRPLTGGGFRFYSAETFRRYFPEFLDKFGSYWNSHSVYFGVLAAHGFPGLFVYGSMIGSCLLSLRRIKYAVKGREDLRWLANYSDMIQVSYIGFLVNGAFNNMEYFDLVYHWVAVVASLKVLARQYLEGTKPVQQPVPDPEVAVPHSRLPSVEPIAIRRPASRLCDNICVESSVYTILTSGR